jgi:hypothetical protein
LALLQVELAAFHSVAGPKPRGGIVTVALVLASRRTGVTRYLALWSSDFPHAAELAPDVARPSGRKLLKGKRLESVQWPGIILLLWGSAS